MTLVPRICRTIAVNHVDVYLIPAVVDASSVQLVYDEARLPVELGSRARVKRRSMASIRKVTPASLLTVLRNLKGLDVDVTHLG